MFRIEVKLDDTWVDADHGRWTYATEHEAVVEVARRQAAGNLTKPVRIVPVEA